MKKTLLLILAFAATTFAFAAETNDTPNNASGLNPFAYNLSQEFNADSTELTLHFWINALATRVKVIFNDGVNDYILRDYNKDVPAEGYKTVINTADLPHGKALTWRVEVTGAAFKYATQVGEPVKMFCPTSVDIDNNPENDNFGTVFCIEARPDAKDNPQYANYISYADGAGLYLLDPDGTPRPMPNQTKVRYGYNGGRVKQERQYFSGSSSCGYSPHRVRVSDDGRIFITSLGVDGQILWEADPYVFSHPNAADWQDRAVVGWSHVMSVKNENTFMATEKRNCKHTYCGIYSLYEGNAETGKFIAGPNIGFDVQGAGKDLKLLMLSGCKEAIFNCNSDHFYCSEYDLGEAKQWTTVPSREIFRGYVVNYLGSQVQYDKNGNVWLCQYRGGTDTTTLIQFNHDGSVAYNEPKQPYRRSGAIRFNNDFTQVAIASIGSGTGGAISVYPVNADGTISWTQGYEIDTKAVTHHSLKDFAWDYAGNLYVAADETGGKSGECIAIYALPHAADHVVSTPAPSKLAFTLPVSTAVEDINNPTTQVEKIMQDGRIYIRTNGELFTTLGVRVQ